MHEPVEGPDVLCKVGKDCFSRLLGKILEIGADSFDRVFGVKGLQEAGFHGGSVIHVSLEYFQTAPPRLGLTSEDAG